MPVRSAVLAACAAVAFVLPGAAHAAVTGPQVGAPAPAFRLQTLDGRTVTLDSYKGKTLIVNTWATWCPPCRMETPDLIAAYRSVHGSAVEFLGVDTTEEAPIVRAFVAAKSVPYAQAIDTGKAFSTAYDIRYFPTTLVIGPDGVLRGRYVDTLVPAQVAAFVADAKAGRDIVVASPLQAKIDALLDPAGFTFAGEPAKVRADVTAATAAIDKAETLTNDSDPAQGQPVDLLRVRSEEVALRDRAIAALEPVLASSEDRVLQARMKGDAASEREHWTEALASYDEALAIDPNDRDALAGVATAARATDNNERLVAAQLKLVQLAPSPDAYIELGNAEKRAHDYPAAADAFNTGIGLARAAVDAAPRDAKAIRALGAVYLYQGRMYAAIGEREKARASFAELTAWALKLPKTNERYAMYLEEAQEGTVALDLAPGGGKTALSLSPWTGPDLPGSVASTIKYRLVVAGTPGRAVHLKASGLPKAWIASFCTDRVCAPFHVDTTVPASGVRVIEFQVIPDGAKTAAMPTVRIDANDGTATATARTIVASR